MWRDISANSSVQGGGCRSVPVHWNCCCCPCGGQWTVCSSLAAGDASLVFCREIYCTPWPWLGALSPVALLEVWGVAIWFETGQRQQPHYWRAQRWLHGLWRAGHPPRAKQLCMRSERAPARLCWRTRFTLTAPARPSRFVLELPWHLRGFS